MKRKADDDASDHEANANDRQNKEKKRKTAKTVTVKSLLELSQQALATHLLGLPDEKSLAFALEDINSKTPSDVLVGAYSKLAIGQKIVSNMNAKFLALEEDRTDNLKAQVAELQNIVELTEKRLQEAEIELYHQGCNVW